MSVTENYSKTGAAAAGKSGEEQRLDSIGWALLLMWIGVVVLANFGWGWGLLGASGIILGTQAALWRSAGKFDGFAVACGVVFLVNAAWILLGLTWPLAPVLLILLGASLLWKAAFGAQAK